MTDMVRLLVEHRCSIMREVSEQNKAMARNGIFGCTASYSVSGTESNLPDRYFLWLAAVPPVAACEAPYTQ